MFLLIEHVDGPAHHILRDGGHRQIPVGVFIGTDNGAVADHRDAVGNLNHLVQEVGDIDDADAFFRDSPGQFQHLCRILHIEHGGGLVHDQDLGLDGKRLQNLHELLIGHRHVLDFGVKIQLDAQLIHLAPGGLGHGFVIDQAGALHDLVAHINVFHHVHAGNQIVFLINDVDAQAFGQGGSQLLVAGSVDFDGALGGGVCAGQNLH